MVYHIIRTVQASLKYRGGWKGLFEHMYTVSSWLMERILAFGRDRYQNSWCWRGDVADT